MDVLSRSGKKSQGGYCAVSGTAAQPDWKNVIANAAASNRPMRESSLIHGFRTCGKYRSNAGICLAIALIPAIKRAFPAPMLAFAYQFTGVNQGKFSRKGIDFAFGLMTQDFDQYQARMWQFINVLRDPNLKCKIRFTVTYPLWRPFGDDAELRVWTHNLIQ